MNGDIHQIYAVRPCFSHDIQKVMEINEATLPENYPLFFYEQILERYPDSFLLAYSRDKPQMILGYIMWRIERGSSSFGLDYVKKAHLVSLAILPKFRRMGIASSLLQKSMKIVQKYKISEYVLEVRVSNTGAIRLYEDIHGFEKIRIISRYYRDGEDAFYMSHKYDPTSQYTHKSMGMSDEEIFRHYLRINQPHICFRCPNCHRLLIKGLNYSYSGSVLINDPSTLTCAYCNSKISKYSISQGKYDIKL
ncbi:GNAT family N-acetyltransferase [Candidatus Harpocratesius sp.]